MLNLQDYSLVVKIYHRYKCDKSWILGKSFALPILRNKLNHLSSRECMFIDLLFYQKYCNSELLSKLLCHTHVGNMKSKCGSSHTYACTHR